MPRRPFNRQGAWLLPPTLDELIPPDHPARFVAAFVDALDGAAWSALGIGLEGEALGAPAYHPRALLSVWLYGFMTKVRSARQLEGACRDQLPYLWLTGWQRPDHNTLWRFYREHRDPMRGLFTRTVQTAVQVGLVDLAVQAIDGTKVAGNAAKDRTYDREGLQRLRERTDAAIRALEAENAQGTDPPPPHLPEALTRAERLRAAVQDAMERLAAAEGRKRINLTDGEAELVKSRQGIVAGYNAQAVVSPVRGTGGGRAGLLLTATDLVADPTDTAHLVPLLDQAEENTGKRAALALVDAGYHSGENLEACEERGQVVVMPEAQDRARAKPYHKDRFVYEGTTDTYLCPYGHALRFRRTKRTHGAPVREYRASGVVCRACPAFGTCTKNGRWGRRLEIGPHERALHRHRAWMATAAAKAAYGQRKELVEPAFGIVKEQLGLRRFLLRGRDNVRAEWTLVATAFNLRTLWRFWRDGALPWPSRDARRAETSPLQPAPSLPNYAPSLPCPFLPTGVGVA